MLLGDWKSAVWSMEAMQVSVRVMDSARPGKEAEIGVRTLSLATRAWRACSRGLGLSVLGVGLALLPLLHLCGAAVALVVGPIFAVFVFRQQALLEAGSLPCAKCERPLEIKAGQAGWPARVHCVGCGAMNEVRPAVSENGGMGAPS